MSAEIPYDHRWGSALDAQEEFCIAPAQLKAAYLAGWIKAVQPNWKDDEHRCQTVYCFDDIQRYLVDVCHEPTYEYTQRFWTAKELKGMVDGIPVGPYKKGSVDTRTNVRD